MKKNNPYANSEGSPIDGKEPEFFEWEKKYAQEQLDKLPAAERQMVIESDAALSNRMNS